MATPRVADTMKISRSRGGGIRVVGLEEFEAKVREVGTTIADQTFKIMKGDFGDLLLQQIKATTSDYSRTGKLVGSIKKTVYNSEKNVTVGAVGDRMHIGTWLESGTRMHLIPTNSKSLPIRINNGFVNKVVNHPGTSARRPAYKALRALRYHLHDALVDGLNKEYDL